MRRTQLYLDDQLWQALHIRAQNEKTTVSELVRQAVREQYMGSRDQRLVAMQRFVGSGRKRADRTDSTEVVRKLRGGSRLDRLG